MNSRALSKEDLARKIAERDGIKEGLVAIFRCVEPCRTYKMRGNYQTKMLKPRLELGKCLHLYFYVQHQRFGWLHLRLQTWFPFLIPICLNGPDWLARQMDEKELRYRKADNRFTWVQDFHKAQALADRQLRIDWVSLCEQLRKTYHPLHEKIARPLGGLSYYWTAPQTEFSSDVLFHADLYRGAQMSRAANDRYLTALAAASITGVFPKQESFTRRAPRLRDEVFSWDSATQDRSGSPPLSSPRRMVEDEGGELRT